MSESLTMMSEPSQQIVLFWSLSETRCLRELHWGIFDGSAGPLPLHKFWSFDQCASKLHSLTFTLVLRHVQSIEHPRHSSSPRS